MTADADLVQGSQEWLLARCGSLGSGSIVDMLARTKSGWGAMRANLMADLVAERLTGLPCETYQSAAMKAGLVTEPEAMNAYAFFHDHSLKPIGLARHPTIPNAHASPDRLVDDDGVAEAKCPYTATHIATCLGASIDRSYRLQMQWEIACTGRKWCDFISYDPRLPQRMRLVVQRIPRDDTLIAEVEREARIFLAEVDRQVEALLARFGDDAPYVAAQQAAAPVVIAAGPKAPTRHAPPDAFLSDGRQLDF